MPKERAAPAGPPAQPASETSSKLDRAPQNDAPDARRPPRERFPPPVVFAAREAAPCGRNGFYRQGPSGRQTGHAKRSLCLRRLPMRTQSVNRRPHRFRRKSRQTGSTAIVAGERPAGVPGQRNPPAKRRAAIHDVGRRPVWPAGRFSGEAEASRPCGERSPRSAYCEPEDTSRLESPASVTRNASSPPASSYSALPKSPRWNSTSQGPGDAICGFLPA